MRTLTQPPGPLRGSDWRTLRAVLPPDGLVTDPVELITYEMDAGLDRGSPQGVAFPRSVKDVVALVRWAADHRLPLVARGAGTGLSGGAVASHGGVILCFSRMNQVQAFDEAGRSVVVQPGVVNLTLDELVKSRGFYYPPDPASGRSATIGGNIAENAGGPHCFKYGVTTNYVTGLQVMLADGEVIRTGGPAYDYPEYDFTGLLTGSEGTLAIVTEASLRLIRNPQGVKTLMATFDSVEAAGEAVSAIIVRGLVPATMEMMDRNIIGIVEDYAHAGLPTEVGAMLIVEVDGYPESLDPQIEEIANILRERQARELRIARTDAERDQIWYARKSAAGAIARLSPAYYLVDVTVPRSKLTDTLAEVNQICARYDLRVGYVFHAGDGNLHPLIFFDPQDEDMVKRVHQVGREVVALSVQQDGAITGEHGVGMEKRGFMPLMYGPDELTVMREVKEIFDPHDLFNPGKVLPQLAGKDAARHTRRSPLERDVVPLAGDFAPQSEEEAADGLLAAQAAGQRVVIQGGGSQGVSASPDEGEIVCLSTEKLRGVVAYAPEDLYVTVQAGTPLADLGAALADDGLWVPLASPWAESTIGGIVSTNLNSPQRMRYGAVRDLVLGVRVVLPDGRRLRFGRPVVKNVAGYDMAKLFVGACGTLGLITEVTLRLMPLPRARRSLLVPMGELDLGLSLGRSLLDLSFVASSVLLCRGCSHPSDVPPGPYLLAFTTEGHPQDMAAELRAARAALTATGLSAIIETEALTGTDLWAGLLRSARRVQGGGPYWRIGVPPKDLPVYLEANASALAEDGAEPTSYIADFASGLIHVCPGATAGISSLRQAALALGGYAVVAPPGYDVGTAPSDGGLVARGYVPETLPLMRRLKARWDPASCLNSYCVK